MDWTLWALGLSRPMGSGGRCWEWPSTAAGGWSGRRQAVWEAATASRVGESGSLCPWEPTLWPLVWLWPGRPLGETLAWCLPFLWCPPEMARAGRGLSGPHAFHLGCMWLGLESSAWPVTQPWGLGYPSDTPAPSQPRSWSWELLPGQPPCPWARRTHLWCPMGIVNNPDPYSGRGADTGEISVSVHMTGLPSCLGLAKTKTR